MGIKKFFKTKAPTQEEVESNIRERMNDRGIPTKTKNKKPSVFGAYAQYANDRTEKKVYAPKGYEEYAENNKGEKIYVANNRNHENNNNDIEDLNANPLDERSNPYESLSSTNSQNPYAGITTTSATTSNPYSGGSSSNPYGSLSSTSHQHSNNPYGNVDGGNSYSSKSSYQQDQQHLSNSLDQGYGRPQQQHHQSQQSHHPRNGNGYAPQQYGSSSANPYAKQSAQGYNNHQYANQVAVEEDLNSVPNDEESINPPPTYHTQVQSQNFDFDDLNADVVREDDYGYQPYLEEEQQEPELTEAEIAQRQEDEEVEQIKNQIRFTKQESVASTRNTLRMAREAEESGQNTAGMLGAQSEMLYNVERNLSLAETQDRIAREKVAQLHHYNRNILKPSVANPFTKSRRLKEQEAKIKSERIQSKIEQERQRRELSNSTNRMKSSLNEAEGMGESITAKYRHERIKEQAKKYQFEEDSEDDEMEKELGENLDEIAKISGRLKKLAMTQGEEIDRQNYRIKDIEEKADRLDINVHLNTASLSRAR